MNDSPPAARGLRALLRRLFHSWATRSLAVGAAATLLDVLVLLVMVEGLGWSNPTAAMAGVTVGSCFTFFANRHFAFRDHVPELAPQAVRFAVATGLGMLAHAGVVHVFADQLGVPVVLAKLGADVCVFTFGQLLVLRYFIFPRAKSGPQAAGPLDVGPLEAGRLEAGRLEAGPESAGPQPVRTEAKWPAPSARDVHVAGGSPSVS